MPVIHVPAFAGPNGVPVGLSLIARRYCDIDDDCIVCSMKSTPQFYGKIVTP